MSQDSTDAGGRDGDPPRTEGDLTGTGMSLKHDREWDYELDRIVDEVDERDAETVGLQFPEGLKRRGPRVADDLRAELREYVKDRLAKYEYPREIEFREELPTTTTGKVRRADLR